MSKIILSVDQATVTGFCCMDGQELLDYGKFTAKGVNYQDKIMDVVLKVQGLIKEFKPDVVVIEDVQLQRLNAATYSKLSGLKFVLEHELKKNEHNYKVLAPPTWRSALGLPTKPRAIAKAHSIAYVNERFGLDIKSDDMADAIAMACAYIEIEENKGA